MRELGGFFPSENHESEQKISLRWKRWKNNGPEPQNERSLDIGTLSQDANAQKTCRENLRKSWAIIEKNIFGYFPELADTFVVAGHLVPGWNCMQALSATELTRMIEQARAGSAEALGQLLELYRSYLRLIASLQAGERLQAKFSPSDLIQATFLQAQRGFQDFQGNSEGELIAWLRKILASQLAMEVRRYSTGRRNIRLERQMHFELDQSSVLMNNMLAARENSPSQSAMRRERAVLLADALAQLPEDYREVIVLRHLKGCSFAEVATQTNRTLDSVKSAWRRAIGKLREALGDGAW